MFAAIGLSVRDGETAQAASFPLIAPLVFASSAFVPVETMPGWLETFARNQPVSKVVDAVRGLTLGTPVGDDVVVALVWIVGIVAVCGTLTIHRYRKAT